LNFGAVVVPAAEAAVNTSDAQEAQARTEEKFLQLHLEIHGQFVQAVLLVV
jgi:hypothetical protein